MISTTRIRNVWIIGIQVISLTSLVYSDRGLGLRLLEMSVPLLADPRDPLTLSCHFDMGGEELNSVKWYKDEQEFFRYMPLQHPSVLTFPVAGVHLGSPPHDIYHQQCTTSQCTVTLVNLTRAHSSGAYKCEVSTEAPTFRVVFSTTNVTVAAAPRERPRVVGLKSGYLLGDHINVSCTSSPSEPPSTITFLINGKPPPMSSTVSSVTLSEPDHEGLVTSSGALWLIADRRHFVGTGTTMEVGCVATVLAVPHIPPQRTALTTALKSTHSLLTNQKLEWAKSTGIICFTKSGLLILLSIRTLQFLC